MNELKVFSSSEFGDLGVMLIEGKEHFPATQCAKILGHENPSRAVRKYCKGVTKMVTPSEGGVQTTNYIPEGDLYRLIVRSQLPAAEKFERWIFDEVLPSIRKNGAYTPNLEELIAKTATAVVSEVMKQIVPIITSAKAHTELSDKPPKKAVKRYKYTTPSKISMLSPQLKQKVDDMLCSGKYSCQEVANYITNSCGMEISQMAVNRYAHSSLWDY